MVTTLAVLACPVGMGLMMWFMMRGMKQPAKRAGGSDDLSGLRAQQQRLEAEVERLRAADEAHAPVSVAGQR